MATFSVTGQARNAKLGAVVIVEDDGVYDVDGLEEWPEQLDGKTVTVSGVLRVVHHETPVCNKAGEYSAGMVGVQNIIENPTWVVNVYRAE
jgi:hypothetical protein